MSIHCINSLLTLCLSFTWLPSIMLASSKPGKNKMMCLFEVSQLHSSFPLPLPTTPRLFLLPLARSISQREQLRKWGPTNVVAKASEESRQSLIPEREREGAAVVACVVWCTIGRAFVTPRFGLFRHVHLYYKQLKDGCGLFRSPSCILLHDPRAVFVCEKMRSHNSGHRCFSSNGICHLLQLEAL